MKPYTYLLVDFLSVIVCFVFSFHRSIQFNRQFPFFFRSCLVVAVPFIAWDIYFTKIGVWWFNMDYTIGQRLLGLPVEEWLFFVCIPFSCVFTFFCLDKFFRMSWTNAFNNIIVFVSVILCTVIALLHAHKMYTMVTASTAALTLVFLHFFARVQWIGQASFVYLILMLGFIPVNGVLTGTGLAGPIVNYNTNEFLNKRFLTIPLEDAVYGYCQFLLSVYFFKLFQHQKYYKKADSQVFLRRPKL